MSVSVSVSLSLSLSSFQGRSSSASSFHTSLLQAVAGVMSLALCPQVVSQAPQHFTDLPLRSKPLVRAASLSARSFPFTPACPGQYTHSGVFEGHVDQCRPLVHSTESGLPIHFSLFVASPLTESVRMMACVVRLSHLKPIQQRAWVNYDASESWQSGGTE